MDFTWKDSYSVGIEKFDEQHKKLVGILARLEDCHKEKKSASDAAEVAKELRDYTVLHFGLEERNMSRYDYPGLENQKEEHEKFREITRDLYSDLVMEKQIDLQEKLEFLFDWLVSHIGQVDKEYDAFFKEKGAQIL